MDHRYATHAERAYPFPDNPKPDQCQHMADREDHMKRQRERRMMGRERRRISAYLGRVER